MADVKIEIRENGPYKVTGSVEVYDENDVKIEIPAEKTSIFLCRCGLSEEKPFCDGTHKSSDWCRKAESAN